MLLYQDYDFAPIQELRGADVVGVMNLVVCLCSLWSNALAENDPPESLSRISLVLSTPMLSNTTNASPCYIFLVGLSSVFVFIWEEEDGECCDIYHWVGMWACVHAYSPFLFICEVWVRYTGCKDEDSNRAGNAGILVGFRLCTVGGGRFYICTCVCQKVNLHPVQKVPEQKIVTQSLNHRQPQGHSPVYD